MSLKAIQNYVKFVGHKPVLFLGIEILIGALWFCVEAAFILVLQGFLVSIGFMIGGEVSLPSWYPSDIASNLTILLVYGLIRSILLGFKKYLPSKASIEFSSIQRRRILSMSLKYKHHKSSSEIISYFTELTGKAGQFVLNFAMSISLAVSSLLAFAFCLKLAPYESLIGFGLSIIFFFPFKYFNTRSRVLGKQQSNALGEMNKVLMEGIKNLFLLKVYNLIDYEIKKGNKQIDAYEKSFDDYTSLSSVIASVPFFFGIIIICIVTYVSRTYLKTDSTLFVAFLYLFLRLNQSLSTLLSSISMTSFYKDPFLKLYSWSDHGQEIGGLNLSKTTVTNENIAFKDLSFAYSKDQPIFEDLNLTIKKGEFFLIKGPSGAGKSTFLKLLFGLETPSTGEIFINGLAPGQYMNGYAEEIGYVGPEPFLIPSTVRENLLYGNPNKNLSDDLIWGNLEKLGLKDIISEMPSGLDEYLYEDTQLSTGQKQRLSFVRALLRDPRILILDEATANIDVRTEKMIVSHLSEIKGKVTVLVISHRDSFDALYDKLFEVKGNKLCNLVVNAS